MSSRAMRVPALLVALFMIVLGVTGVILPHRLLSIAEFTVTPAGLYVSAAVRLLIGIILLAAASRSRFPKVLYLFGALAIVGGFATLFLGVERARAIADWASSRGANVVRLFGLFALALGSFIAYATSNKSFEHEA